MYFVKHNIIFVVFSNGKKVVMQKVGHPHDNPYNMQGDSLGTIYTPS